MAYSTDMATFNSNMTALGNAVRTKTGETGTLTVPQMTTALNNIPEKSSSDLTASGATVTVPAGNYKSQATKSVASGSATTPATTIQQSQPAFSVSGDTIIATVAATSVDITPTVNPGYVTTGTAGTVTMSANDNTYTIHTQDKITNTSGRVFPDPGFYLSSVFVDIPPYYDLS